MKERVVGQCYAKGCTRTVKPSVLMCWPHWKRVPRSIQDAIWNSNSLDHPMYAVSRYAGRRAVAIKELKDLRPGDKSLLADYGIGIDGYPIKAVW